MCLGREKEFNHYNPQVSPPDITDSLFICYHHQTMMPTATPHTMMALMSVNLFQDGFSSMLLIMLASPGTSWFSLGLNPRNQNRYFFHLGVSREKIIWRNVEGLNHSRFDSIEGNFNEIIMVEIRF